MTSSRTMRRAGAVTAAAAVTMLVTGCLKADFDMTLSGDTVSGTMLTAVDAESLQMFGIPPEEIFAEGDQGLDEVDGVTSEPYDDGTWIGVMQHLDNVPIEELNAESQETGLVIDYDPAEGIYEVSMDMDMTFDDLDDMDDPAGGDEFPAMDPAMFMDDLEVTVAITFPGEVIDHNGELDGTTVRWAPQPGDNTVLRAVASDSGSGAAPTDTDDSATDEEPASDDNGADDAAADPEATGADSGLGAGGWFAIAAIAVAVLGVGAVFTAILVARKRSTPPTAPSA